MTGLQGVLCLNEINKKIENGGFFVERRLKINGTSGYKYQEVPTLQIKGKYLEQFGFPIDTKVAVSLENNKIVIIPLAMAKANDGEV